MSRPAWTHARVGRWVEDMSPRERQCFAYWIATKEAARVRLHPDVFNASEHPAYYAWNRVHAAIDEALNLEAEHD